MRNATLLFLIKKSGGAVTDICLAMKKRGFGVGRWNGAGGKVQEGETIEQAMVREVQEELGVLVKNPDKVAELTFTFPHKPEWDQIVHAYLTDAWDGEPAESEEMRPHWFPVSDIPYDDMWPDDKFWLPLVLEGKLIKAVKARFVFGEKDVILEQKIDIVNTL